MMVILVGHGKIGTYMLESVEMVIGDCEDFFSVEFHKGEGPYDILDKYKEIIKKNEDKEVLIITDLFGGSPYNAAAMLAIENDKVEVITGLSLPLCVEIATTDIHNISALIASLKDSSKDFVKSFRDQIIENEEDL